MYDEENHDYGFDLPDTRYEFISYDGKVSVHIIRHWYMNDDEDEPDFKVSFDIHFKAFEDSKKRDEILSLPVGTREEQAISIAHTLWETDEEATKDNNETLAEYESERRMGA